MSCHYSCSSCSGPTYLYLCNSCPSTRQLVGTACLCRNNYSETQANGCTLTSQLAASTTTLVDVADVLYAVNIAFLWVYIIILLCKVYHPKLRMILNFAQVTSLILYYPFRHDQIAERSLRALSSLNFTFFTELICTQSGPPYQCQFYENLIGPGFMIVGFLLCFLISFLIIHCCYRKPYIEQNIDFKMYWKRSRLSLLFHILDVSIIYMAISLTRIVILSFWAFLLIVPLLIFLVIIMRYLYLIMNSEKQMKLEHRTKYNWAYIYDENYSFHYIDYLYGAEQEKRKNSSTIDYIQINQIAEQPKIQPFFPHSNFIFFQILFKYLSGTSVVLLYEYKPALMAYVLTFILLVQFLWFGVFCIYQRSDLVFYIFLISVYMLSVSTFWLSYYWLVSFIITALYTALLVCFFTLVIIVFQRASSKQITKMFEENQSEYGNKTEKSSEDELIVKGVHDFSSQDHKEETKKQKEPKEAWFTKRSSSIRQKELRKSVPEIVEHESLQNSEQALK